ncbi:MAG: coenzyme A pyrophosphatase [Marinilabiliales bacterium]|nr:MAG: coenzyme A pyrophosphatase [Marinilabiliales bacterium]
MNKFLLFKDKLKTSLQNLPGIEAQLKMAPITRLQELQKQRNSAKPRKSAVLVLFYPYKEKLMLVLMKRTDDNTVHSGQISFPGGKYEKQDKNLQETALREANEEMGIIPEKVEIIGELSKLYIPPSNFEVFPYVGFTAERPDFIANKIEVARIIETEVNILLNPATFTKKDINHRNGSLVNVPCYYFDNNLIWGATAMLISELTMIINNDYNEVFNN